MSDDFAQYLVELRTRARHEDVSKPVTPDRAFHAQFAQNNPDYHERQSVREGKSEWSGNSWINRGW
jgi:hypothetical protein